jgi:hypothetical protein
MHTMTRTSLIQTMEAVSLFQIGQQYLSNQSLIIAITESIMRQTQL